MALFSTAKSIRRVRSFAGLWRYRRELGAMIREMLRGSYRASFATALALVAGILYILMPFDVLPDFIPLLGWLDDGAVVYLILRQLIREVNRYLAFKKPFRVIR